MTMPRKNPPAPGEFCDATRTRYPGPCSDPAVFIVWWHDKDTGEQHRDNACGAHLGKLVTMRQDQAEFSREMFRVVPWEVAIAESAKKSAPETASA